jgi:hypothetical protein
MSQIPIMFSMKLSFLTYPILGALQLGIRALGSKPRPWVDWVEPWDKLTVAQTWIEFKFTVPTWVEFCQNNLRIEARCGTGITTELGIPEHLDDDLNQGSNVELRNLKL